jgi:hypothetical protein
MLTRFVLCLCIWSAPPALVLAGVGSLDYTEIRESGVIVLATLADVKAVIVERNEADTSDRKGFSFSLRIEEVLHGSLTEKSFSIPFSGQGHGSHWHTDSVPHNDDKVLVYLEREESGIWTIPEVPDAIEVLPTFDDPSVRTLRKIIGLWRIARPEGQLEAVRQGLHDDVVDFRCMCVRILALDPFAMGVDISRVLSKGESLSTIWSVYTDPTTPLEVTVNCDWELSQEFRAFNWETFEPRYAVLNSAIRRHVESRRATDNSYWDWSVTSAFSFANHAAANFELCRMLAQSRIEDYRTTGPHRVALVYQATTRNAEQLELNAKILQYLSASLNSKELLESAGYAVVDIARMHVDLGELPDALLPLLDKCRPGFDKQLQALATEARARIDKLASQLPLGSDWRSSVGQSVYVYGRRGYRGRWPEASLRANYGDLWIDGLDEWPKELNSTKRLLVTGKLIERNDIPVFRYTKDGKWGEGLPVPTGYDMKAASTRYLLKDAKWQVVD